MSNNFFLSEIQLKLQTTLFQSENLVLNRASSQNHILK